mmetsp:Transcript_17125/g.40146  ORF Transcript_17125/g.40146 Transcript_17125/m.40146 type:complete len:323 (+) Transcript_17125:1360-2328(+)
MELAQIGLEKTERCATGLDYRFSEVFLVRRRHTPAPTTLRGLEKVPATSAGAALLRRLALACAVRCLGRLLQRGVLAYCRHAVGRVPAAATVGEVGVVAAVDGPLECVRDGTGVVMALDPKRAVPDGLLGLILSLIYGAVLESILRFLALWFEGAVDLLRILPVRWPLGACLVLPLRHVEVRTLHLLLAIILVLRREFVPVALNGRLVAIAMRLPLLTLALLSPPVLLPQLPPHAARCLRHIRLMHGPMHVPHGGGARRRRRRRRRRLLHRRQLRGHLHRRQLRRDLERRRGRGYSQRGRGLRRRHLLHRRLVNHRRGTLCW